MLTTPLISFLILRLLASQVGSERTIDLLFENTASREASYQLFDLLVKSVHEKAKQKQLSQYRNALVVKKRNKYSDFMAAIKMSRALMSQAGVRVNLVLAHGHKEPRNLRILHGGRLVPTALSFEEVSAHLARGSATPFELLVVSYSIS